MKDYLEYCVLARKLLSIFLRELNVYVEGVACVVADNLLLKAGDELTGAECQVVFFGLAAFKGLAVGEAFKIDNSDVAVLSGSVLNGEDSCVPRAWLSLCSTSSASTLRHS